MVCEASREASARKPVDRHSEGHPYPTVKNSKEISKTWNLAMAASTHRQRKARKDRPIGVVTMHIMHPQQALYALYLLFLQGTSNVPGQGLLNSISAFITGPFGKAITLIAIVLCGVSYMYGKQSDNANIGRMAIGAALIVGAANIFAYIQQAG
jgi:type IV secretory pathway VirB2 component (pilin)